VSTTLSRKSCYLVIEVFAKSDAVFNPVAQCNL
jgi:hypothetical protein